MINAVLKHVLDDDQDVLREALAILYSYQQNYDYSLRMYLKYKIVNQQILGVT